MNAQDQPAHGSEYNYNGNGRAGLTLDQPAAFLASTQMSSRDADRHPGCALTPDKSKSRHTRPYARQSKQSKTPLNKLDKKESVLWRILPIPLPNFETCGTASIISMPRSSTCWRSGSDVPALSAN